MFNRIRRILNRRRVKRVVQRTGDNSGQVTAALKGLKGCNTRTWKRITLDKKYWLCSREHFQTIIRYNKINEKQYTSDQFDCDNFAFAFKAQVALNHGLNNVGLVIDNSGGHAYNVIIFNDGTAALFEPQTDKYVTPGQSEMYSFERGIIIL